MDDLGRACEVSSKSGTLSPCPWRQRCLQSQCRRLAAGWPMILSVPVWSHTPCCLVSCWLPAESSRLRADEFDTGKPSVNWEEGAGATLLVSFCPAPRLPPAAALPPWQVSSCDVKERNIQKRTQSRVAYNENLVPERFSPREIENPTPGQQKGAWN